MLRLTKKTEYALLALRSLARATDGLVTTKAIAQRYQIPEMLLAKVLQKLKKHGIVSGAKGSGGGYRLAADLGALPLTDVLGLFDDHKTLVECQDEDGGHCQQRAHCDIKSPLQVLNEAIMEPLRRMSVRDLFEPERPARETAGLHSAVAPGKPLMVADAAPRQTPFTVLMS